MHWSEDEIALARQMKSIGLPWEPQPGHYVYDEVGIIEVSSPFQERVYFILDLKHFLRRSGTTEKLVQSMVWLPDWKQTRQLLRDAGVTDAEWLESLQQSSAFEQGTEFLCMYSLLNNRLASSRNRT